MFRFLFPKENETPISTETNKIVSGSEAPKEILLNSKRNSVSTNSIIVPLR